MVWLNFITSLYSSFFTYKNSPCIVKLITLGHILSPDYYFLNHYLLLYHLQEWIYLSLLSWINLRRMLVHKAAIYQIISNCACFPSTQETWPGSQKSQIQSSSSSKLVLKEKQIKNKKHSLVDFFYSNLQESLFKSFSWIDNEKQEIWLGSQKSQIPSSSSSKLFLQVPDQRRNIIGALDQNPTSWQPFPTFCKYKV